MNALPRWALLPVLDFLLPEDVCHCEATCSNVKNASTDWLWRSLAGRCWPFSNAQLLPTCKSSFKKRFRLLSHWRHGRPGQYKVHSMRAHESAVTDVAVCPTTHTLVALDASERVSLWALDGPDGRPVCIQEPCVEMGVGAVFASNTRIMVLTSRGELLVLDPLSGRAQSGVVVREVLGALPTAAFVDREGAAELAVVGSANGGVLVWDVAGQLAAFPGLHPQQVLDVHAIDSAVVSADQQSIVVTQRAEGGGWESLPPIHVAAPDEVRCVRLMDDGEMVVVGTNRQVLVYKTSTGRLRANFVDPAASPVASLTVHGKVVLAREHGTRVRVLNVGTGRERVVEHTAGVTGTYVDACKIITCSQDNTIKVLDATSGTQFYVLLGGSTSRGAGANGQGVGAMAVCEEYLVAAVGSVLRLYRFS